MKVTAMLCYVWLFFSVTHCIVIDIFNRGNFSAALELRPKDCCLQSDLGCEVCRSLAVHLWKSISIPQPVYRTVDPYTTERVLFYITSQTVLDKTGYCDFDIVQHGVVDLSQRVPFDTTNAAVQPAPQPITEGIEYFTVFVICQASNVYHRWLSYKIQDVVTVSTHARKIRYEYKQLMFTFKEMDPDTHLCRKVDCTAKYGGLRDFYNVASGLCEPYVTCTSTVIGTSVYVLIQTASACSIR